MNDADLDALAKRAAARTQAEARDIADSDAALHRLLADSAATAPAPLAPVVPYHGPLRDADRRSTWKLVAVAAVVAVFVGGIGYALAQGSGTIEIADGPISGTGVGTGDDIGVGTATSAPPTAAPATAPPGSAGATTMATAPGSSTDTAGTNETPGSSAPPSTSPADPTAGFFVPELQPVTLDAVPRLLATPPPPADRTYLSANAGDAADPALSQLWVRTTSGDAVDAILHVTTRLSPAIRSGDSSSIAVPGWSSARTWEMAAGTVDVELWGDDVFVELWASGLTEDEVLAIAAELRADGSAWRAERLDAEPWTRFQQMWSTGVAARSALTLDAEGDIDTELDVLLGADAFDSAPLLQATSDLRLVDVGGDPGLLGRPGASGLVVARPDGSIIVIGSRDPEADLVGAATSLVEVDEATWQASGRPRPSDWDGCMSFFC